MCHRMLLRRIELSNNIDLACRYRCGEVMMELDDTHSTKLDLAGLRAHRFSR